MVPLAEIKTAGVIIAVSTASDEVSASITATLSSLRIANQISFILASAR
jgi:hypothetical protein